MKNIVKWLSQLYLKVAFGRFGKSSWVNPFGTFLYRKKIFVGNNVYIGKGAHISVLEGIQIGDGVTIGPEFMVMGGNHKFNIVGKQIWKIKNGGENQLIVIEDDVWIGARVTVLKGAVIGEGAIVGACSVVTKEVPPYTIYAGNPARKLGTRFSREDLEKHLEIIGSKYSICDLEKIFAD